MNKFKSWLKSKLKNYLDIDNNKQLLDDYIQVNNKNIERLRLNIQGLESSVKLDTKHFYERHQHNEESIRVLHKTIENVVHVGTDVRENYNNREHSWAVICIEGNINIVKFVELNRNDAREIMNFLKHFEGGRHCIDTPRKEMFYDGIFKF
jgi:hypothetical protein